MSGERERWQALVAPVLDGKCRGVGGNCIECGEPTGAANRELGGAVRLRCNLCALADRRRRDRERRHIKKVPGAEAPGTVAQSHSDC